MAASTSISDAANVSNNQLAKSINNSHVSNFQTSSVVKSEPLDGESFIEDEDVAEKTNEDTKIFQRTDFGLWDIEQRFLEEKTISFKRDEYAEDFSGPKHEEALDESNSKISCDICGRAFTQTIDFRKHMKIHKKSITCDVCNRCFSQKSQLQTHMKTHDRKTVNKCAFCEKTFQRKNALQMHTDSLHTMTTCNICGRQIPGMLMLKYHNHAHEHEKLSRDFCCDTCGEIYKTVDSFRTHLDNHKEAGRPFTCEICGKSFTTITSIGRHMPSHKANNSSTHQSSHPSSDSIESSSNCASTSQTLKKSHVLNPISVFTCELCDETFLSELKLETHYESHKSECMGSKQREKTVDSGTSLKNHEENAHKTTTCNISKEEINHNCDLCGNQFAQLSRLRRHMTFHHQQKNECDKCGRSFSTIRSLHNHMKIHLTTEFPKCEICDQSFKTKDVLKRHMRTHHTNESCDSCGLQINRQLMGNHKLAHDHENKSRDFICCICEDIYKDANSFRRHFEIHMDDDRPYTCEVCGKAFTAVKDMNDHGRSHRDGLETHGHRNSEVSCIKNENTLENEQLSELDEFSIGQQTKSDITCNLCGKKFSSKLVLDLHWKRHRRVEKKCDKRKEMFKTEITLHNRIDNIYKKKPRDVLAKTLTNREPKHHRTDRGITKRCIFSRERMNDNKSECEICGKQFVHNSSLKLHMKIHQQSIKCDRCGCCFSSKHNLNSHMKIHFRTVVAKCEFCDQSFKTKGLLQMHMRSFHTNVSCDICGQQIHPQLIGNHKTAHEYEDKSLDFVCSICQDSYKSADSFRTHLEIHKDEDRPYTCEICGKTFIAIKTLKVHARTHRRCTDKHEHQNPEHLNESDSGSVNVKISESQDNHSVHEEKVMFQCDFCGKMISQKCNLDSHVRIHQCRDRKCEKCDKAFRTEIALKNHIDLAHNEKPCEICGKIMTKGDLIHHRAEHLHNKKHKCETCGKQFSKLNGLKTHMSVHLNNKKYVCDICEKRFLHSTGLTFHMKCHRQSIKCKTCGRCFSRNENLRTHMKIHERTVFPKCELCDQSFKTKGILQRHMRSFHTNESCDVCGKQINRLLMRIHKLAHDHESKSRDFICSVCEESFKTIDSFCTHLEIHKDEDRPYTCEICGKTYIAIQNIKKHAREHVQRSNTYTHEDSENSEKNESVKKQLQTCKDLQDSVARETKLFPGDLCGRKFPGKFSLNAHLRRHQNVEKSCDKCEKTFKSEIALKNHIDLAHNEKLCDVCGKLLTKGDMKHHMAEHLHNKKHKCDTCGKQFPKLKGLKTHMSVHLNDKKYVCDICGKRFLHSTGLTLHMKCHRQPIKCETCGRCFSRNENLRTHMKIHERTGFPKCELCDKSFKTKGILQRHMRSFHTNESCDVCGNPIHGLLMRIHKLAHDHESKSRDFMCSVCEESFKTVDSFRTHLEIHKDEDRPYTCEICGKTFISIRYIKNHVRKHVQRSNTHQDSENNGTCKNHLQMSKEPCDVCGKLLTKGDMKRHRAEHLHNKEHKCDTCGEQFSKLEGLKTHMSVHLNDKKYVCDICGKRFLQIKGLQVHMEFHRQSNKLKKPGRCFSTKDQRRSRMKIHLKTEIPKCELCDKSCKTEVILQRHIRTHHTIETCDICGLKINRLLMGIHKLAHEKERNSRYFICCICENRFKSAVGFRSHLVIHKNDAQPYACEVCGKGFSDINHVRFHTRLHKESPDTHTDSEAPYDKKRNGNRNLKMSELSKEIPKPTTDSVVKEEFKCDICFKGFTSSRKLSCHRKFHKNACSICGKCFSGKTALFTHMLRHKSNSCQTICKKRYKCKVCRRPLWTKLHLMNHHRQHMKSKKATFKCDGCALTFTTELKREAHFNALHVKKSCNKCEKKFSTALLKGHKKLHDMEKQELILKDKVKIPKGKRGHKRESMIPYLKPKEIRIDSILLKKNQISNLSSKEREKLNEDRNFFNCILRKCIDELGMTSTKGDNFTRLKAKLKEWVLNIGFEEAGFVKKVIVSARNYISYKTRRTGESVTK